MGTERRADHPSLDEARTALRELFGHTDFREGQADVVRALLDGSDVLAIMPTGAGKSLCYQLAGLLLNGCTLIISPLLALMKDQVDGLPPAVHARTALFSSLVDRDTLTERQAGLLAGHYKLVYATPERLRQRSFVDALRRAGCSLVVVDEAHCVSLWGHDFRPDYLFVRRALDLLGQPRLLAMTATATPAIQHELGERFGRPLMTVATGVLRPNLRLEVQTASDREAKLRALVYLCQSERGSGIVYVTSREQAEDVAMLLRRRGVTAGHYHAGMPREDREVAQDAFMLDRVRVMVATTAFGMGVDKANVRFVVHLSPPRSLEAYVQESGRAGRDRRPARCVLLASRGDRATLRRWVKDDRLEIDVLRRVFTEVRRAAENGIAAIAAADLTRRAVGNAAQDSDETRVRVALGLLEQVGLLRRHLDVPRWLRLEVPAGHAAGLRDGTPCNDGTPSPGATADVNAAGGRCQPGEQPLSPACPSMSADAEFVRVASALGLRAGRSVGGHPLELARGAGVPAEELEGLALGWQSEGRVRVEQSGRQLLLELLPAPPDAAIRVQTALDAWELSQNCRIDALLAYVDTRRCRHRTVAAHFQVRASDTCDACDVCCPLDGESSPSATPQSADPTRASNDPVRTLLACVGGLPFAVGKRKLALITRGSVQAPIGPDRCPEHGALGAMAVGAIEREIDGLLARGLLTRVDGDFPVLALTAAGHARLAEPPRPPTARPGTPAGSSRPDQAAHRHRSGPGVVSGTPASEHGKAGDARLSGIAWGGNGGDAEADDVEAERRFERLRVWNRGQAASEGVPAYCVFSLATLREIARRRPADLATLSQVPGIGRAKLERYGSLVIELLHERPDA
ncbi:MAG: ATP-dependent DNA helicase RecQ [Chloroflexi bacterium]|nr:ATP-dependent DNA helicase RecQ [Chloroflexota bacterium]